MNKKLVFIFSVPFICFNIFGQTYTWRSATSLPLVRSNHTVTLLQNNKILVVGGTDGNNVLDPILYDSDKDAWVNAGTMITNRYKHGAVLLPNGKVLVAGGADLTGIRFASVEIYDPISNSWSLAASLPSARSQTSMTMLKNGKILIAGGENGGAGPTNEALLYDYILDTWVTTTNTISVARFLQTATLLNNGNVLLVGGLTSDMPNTTSDAVDIYNPVSDSWSAGTFLQTSRFAHTATLMVNGKVLVAGGWSSAIGGNGLDSVHIYDPATDTWAVGASMPVGVDYLNAVLLPNGLVAAIGGNTNVSVNNVSLYNYLSDTWTAGPVMITARHSAGVVLLPDQEVLVIAGGATAVVGGRTNAVERFDFADGFWKAANPMNVPRTYFTTTTLANGKVLAAGGSNVGLNTPTNQCEIYDPATGNWTLTGNMTSVRYYHSATLLPDGRVFVAGGETAPSTYITSCEIYDPGTGLWTAATPMATIKSLRHTSTLLFDGKVLVAGNYNAEIYDPISDTWSDTISFDGGANFDRQQAVLLPDKNVMIARTNQGVQIYNPCNNTWRAVTNLPVAGGNRDAIMHLLPDEQHILYAGGVNAGIGTTNSYLFDINTEIWSATGNMSVPRYEHNSIFLPNGKIMVAGGFSGGYKLETDIYDPITDIWTNVGNASFARADYGINLLPNGTVLKIGGHAGTPSVICEIFDIGYDTSDAPRPTISSLSTTSIIIPAGSNAATALEITGTGFADNNRIGSESSNGGGSLANAATNYPVVQMARIGGDKKDIDFVKYLSFDVDNYSWDSTKTQVLIPHDEIPAGVYAVRVYSNGLISEPAYLKVAVSCNVVADFTTDTVCIGGSTSFTNITSGTPDSCWVWSFGDGDTDYVNQPSHIYADTGVYFVTLTSRSPEGCFDTITRSVYVKSDAAISYIADTAICKGEMFQYSIPYNGDNYNWIPSLGLSDSTLQNPIITIDSTQGYTILIYGDSSCSPDTLFFNVDVFLESIINALADSTIIKKGQSVLLYTLEDMGSYQWTPAAFIDNPDSPSTIAFPSETTTFVLTGIDSNGCIVMDSITITVDTTIIDTVGKYLFVPNAFTPDGSMNKYFNISSGPINQISVSIYDNLGTLIFFTDDLSVKWNGTYRGLEVEGVFVYKVTGEFADNTTFDQSGNVQVIR